MSKPGCSISTVQTMAAKYKTKTGEKISTTFNKEQGNLLVSFWEADLWGP